MIYPQKDISIIILAQSILKEGGLVCCFGQFPIMWQIIPIIWRYFLHYNDVIMSMMASQITSQAIIYSTVCSGTDQRKPLSSASLAFVRGIHPWEEIFSFDDVIMNSKLFGIYHLQWIWNIGIQKKYFDICFHKSKLENIPRVMHLVRALSRFVVDIATFRIFQGYFTVLLYGIFAH